MYRMEVNPVVFETALVRKQKQIMRDIKTIAELIRDDIKENLMSGRKVPSGKMKDNTKATKEIKHMTGYVPMFNTGSLYNSISIRPIQDGYEIFINGERNNDAAFYNHTDRMQEKIFGRPFKRGAVKVPGRPFFGIRSKIKKDLKTILNG